VTARQSDDSPAGLIPVAAEGFAWRVHAVAPDAWSARTPAEEWTVRDLVNHLVGEQLWVPHLLRGETLEQVGDRYDGDVVGDDPVAAWDTAADRAVQAWAALDDEQRPVHTSMGPIPAREYGEQMLMDLTVHAWDLARGAGIDDRLDEQCVAHVLGYVRPHIDEWQGFGVFAPPVATDSKDSQDQLLALTGRRPG
jgi:uncharacterized protein (TIGR03086 family)